MAIGKRIIDLEQTTTVSNGSNYMVETAAGTMRIRHDDLSKEVAKTAKFGDLDALDTEDKDTLIGAINEVYKKSETPFTGTDGVKDGTTGAVPAPSKDDKGKVLGSDGRWVSPSGGGGGGVVDSTDVEFADGKNAEEKVGDIDGITDDLNSENSRIAASSVAVKKLSDNLGEIPTFITDDTGKITGYKTKAGADSVFPFSSNNILVGNWYDVKTSFSAVVGSYYILLVNSSDDLRNLIQSGAQSIAFASRHQSRYAIAQICKATSTTVTLSTTYTASCYRLT